MPPIARDSALKLVSTARELGAEALRGKLERDQSGRWTVGHIEIESWLSRYAGEEVIVAAAAIDQAAPAVYARVCRTCGTRYEGSICPHCDAVRRRLRGR